MNYMRNYMTVYKSICGWKATEIYDNLPIQTGYGVYDNEQGAINEGIELAKSENVPFIYGDIQIFDNDIVIGETLFLPNFDYDEESDVLYMNFGKPEASGGIEVGNGTTIFKTPEGRLTGITIIDFKKRVLNGKN